MNANTKDYLIAFITAVENLADAVSSVAGTHATKEIYENAERLKVQLESDETIL